MRDRDTGAPLAGASVGLPDQNRVTSADANGRYILVGVPPGPQHIAVRFIGYAPRLLDALVPSAGRLEIDVALRAEPLRLQTIVARPAVVVRGLEEDPLAYPDRGLSLAAIRSDPLLAEPDALEALGGGEVVLATESPNGMHVRGGAADQTAFELDGVPVLSPYHSAGLFGAWNTDALARVSLRSSGLPDGATDALSGTVEGETRGPGQQIDLHGALSTTQGRLTMAGPTPLRGVGFLISVRSGFRSGWPGGIASEPEPQLLRGETGDRLVTLTAMALGGRLRLLSYDNDNELSAASVAGTQSTDPGLPRNRFEWESQSVGGEWRRELNGSTLRVAAWRATSDVGADWLAQAGRLGLTSERRDVGALAAVERRSAGRRTQITLRVERRRLGYAVTPDSGTAPFGLASTMPIAKLSARQERTLNARWSADVGASAMLADGAMWLDPGVELRWRAAERLVISGSYSRRHQVIQSLRNAESIVGNIFPAELPVGGSPGVPVARGDQAVVGAEWRPSAGLRLGAQGYLRTFDGLLLPAAATGEPFAVSGIASGTGVARGLSVETSLAAARYAVRAAYAFEHVRLASGGLRYVPEFADTHRFEAGLVVFPTPTWAIRVSGTGAAGRHATTIPEAVEWESCNLRDQGCELAGSPHYVGAALGATRLPLYLSFEIGVRKHWHVRLRSREATLGVFGTVTNLLGRTNVLTYADDRTAGAPGVVELRPRSPLVIGLDWQF